MSPSQLPFFLIGFPLGVLAFYGANNIRDGNYLRGAWQFISAVVGWAGAFMLIMVRP